MNKPLIPSAEFQIPMPTRTSVNLAHVQVIQVEWDPMTGGVILTPSKVKKDTTVLFENPKGGKVRVVFLSPTGSDVESVLHSEVITMTTAGAFPFDCFFTFPGATKEVRATIGGILQVSPHVP